MTVPWPTPQVPVQDGWRCPVCGTVNAPWAPVCMGQAKHADTAPALVVTTKDTETK